MDDARLLQELLALLESKDVRIRNEPLGGSGGGLCSVKGEQIFFVDSQAPSAISAALCAEAVVKVLNIEEVYIKPEIRQFIESHTETGKNGQDNGQRHNGG